MQGKKYLRNVLEKYADKLEKYADKKYKEKLKKNVMNMLFEIYIHKNNPAQI